MKPAPFTYVRPRDLQHALHVAAEEQGLAKFVAGNQTLGPMMNLRLAQPELLIDISVLSELRSCSEESGRVLLGGGVTHAMIEDGRVPDPSAGLLVRAASSLAYRSVRNRGTIGGSLAHADPSAEWPTVFTALDADVHLKSATGTRSLPVDAFLTGAMTTALEDQEIVEAVSVPRLQAGVRWGYHKICRKAGEFANAMAVVILGDSGGSRAVLGALDRTPLKLKAVADRLEAGDGDESALRAAMNEDTEEAGFRLDDYEQELHWAALRRAVREARNK
ncbi:FAD binding domain-containing protein [Fodinicurvata halophila]|uniref:FAD binding domain-containing protein n=1 Tax=Fodinicurvata halophila TaxID=1419723 RepID=A0ABV8UG59_9PROT